MSDKAHKTQQNFFPLIQVLRGLAAVMVIIGHTWHEAHTGWGAESFAYPFGAGVHMFFVISGFVIAYSARSLCGSITGIRTFAWRRIVRIVPLYWFYTALMILAIFLFPHAIQTGQFSAVSALKSLSFIPYEDHTGAMRPILSLGWTLNYEMYFYLIFAAFVFLPFNKIATALSVFFVLSVIAGAFLIPEAWKPLKFWWHPIVLEFLAGVWIGYLKRQSLSLPRWCIYPAIVSALSMLVSLHFIGPAFYLPVMAAMGITLVGGATLIQGMDAVKVPRVLSSIGDSSYTLYLSHPFAIGLMAIGWSWLPTSMQNPYIWMILTILAAIFGGYIAYILIERPLLSLFKKRNKALSFAQK